MKLKFDQSCIAKWDGKVIYAPNGFGKTQSSQSLKQALTEIGNRPGLFTRRAIQKMLSFDDGTIFTGSTADMHREKESLEKHVNSNAALQTMLKDRYQVKSATAAKEKCFTMKRRGITNVHSIDLKDGLDGVLPLGEDELAEVETFLNVDLWNRCENLCKAALPKTRGQIRGSKGKTILLPSASNAYKELVLFANIFNLRKCPLCGHRYRDAESLQRAIENNRAYLIEADIEAKDIQFQDLAYEIIKAVLRSHSAVIQGFFSERRLKGIRLARQIVHDYAELGFRAEKTTIGQLRQAELDVAGENDRPITYGQAVDTIAELSTKIKEIEGTPSAIAHYNRSLISEANKLINWNVGVSIRAIKGRRGIELLHNEKPVKDIYSFLSESEVKRLSLAALKVEVQYGGFDALILDDPIDSYDDYNKYSVALYLHKMVTHLSLKHSYILTNDFETVINICGSSHRDAIIYLENPDDIFTTSSIATLQCEASYSKVKNVLSKNELFFLAQLVCRKETDLDGESSYIALSLITTLRNLGNEFLQYLPGIKKIDGVTQMQWRELINEGHVACAEHYRSPLLSVPSAAKDSNSFTLDEFTEPLRLLSPTRAPLKYAWKHEGDSTKLNAYRQAEVQSPLRLYGTYKDVVNSIYKKMSAISWIKYEFEKKLIQLMEPSSTPAEIQEITEAKGLGLKIGKAKGIDTLHGKPLATKLSEFASIHDSYSRIYNAFDHCTFSMVFPYLSVSVLEIRKFWQAVKAL